MRAATQARPWVCVRTCAATRSQRCVTQPSGGPSEHCPASTAGPFADSSRPRQRRSLRALLARRSRGR
jgi:hypothetical protein